jgi:RecA-family ATPase
MLDQFEAQVKNTEIVGYQHQIVSVESIANAEIDDKPVIKGLMDERESLIISAASGAGKSLLTNCIALVLGNPPREGLWNLFHIPNEVKTLIVQSENGFNAFNKRLNKLFKAYPDMRKGAKNVFTVQTKNDCRIVGNLTDKKFQQFLIDSLLSVDARVLILDPLISYHGEDENDNAAMRRSLDCLSMVCDRANAAVILCHHYNRQNLTRGAASIRDWADNMLLMDFEKKTGNSTILKMTHDKARNYEQQPDFYLERTSDLQFLRCEKPGKQARQIEAVITTLKKMGGSANSQAHLKKAVIVELNCSEPTARRAINDALEMRKIVTIPGEGQAYSYVLPT